MMAAGLAAGEMFPRYMAQGGEKNSLLADAPRTSGNQRFPFIRLTTQAIPCLRIALSLILPIPLALLAPWREKKWCQE
ncbi:hypothetical protein [Noviherbaspirillum sp.]|uniref:hypothetical protein n=1 Tax=Noviherbaspirillum sp. TaxID=1926288 RepID=UPI002B47DB4E|nr:hypothetical protein [Noviherbaspirillum sp.]